MSSDAATKNYVDAAIRGLSWHTPVRVATSTNTTLSSPGTSIDGVTLANGDRVLLFGQSTQSQNGLWVFNGSAAAMTRPTDYASAATISPIAVAVSVEAGTTNGDKIYLLYTSANANPQQVVVDTDATTWNTVAGGGATYTAGNGINITSNVVSAVAGTGITVNGSGINVNTSVVVQKYTTTLSTSSTSYTITHNLGTQYVQTTVFNLSTGAVVYPDVANTNTTTTTITFASAPTAGTYGVVCMG
ncbi:hypothetical protein [Nocardia sp. NPDC046763]|uniref:hypothetical protein n=1 Tax=Nocardia sp. NPDC046763 TaxID=3155256 RepID=UPI0033FDB7BB